MATLITTPANKKIKLANFSGDSFSVSYISMEFGHTTRYVFHIPEMLPHGYAVNAPEFIALRNHGIPQNPIVVCRLAKKPAKKGRGPAAIENSEHPLLILCLPYAYGSLEGYYCMFYRNNVFDSKQIITKENPGQFAYIFE